MDDKSTSKSIQLSPKWGKLTPSHGSRLDQKAYRIADFLQAYLITVILVVLLAYVSVFVLLKVGLSSTFAYVNTTTKRKKDH